MMNQRVLTIAAAVFACVAVPSVWAAQGQRRPPVRPDVAGSEFAVFAPAAESVRGAVYHVQAEGESVALATMIAAEGLAVTKASEMPRGQKLRLVTQRGRAYQAVLIGTDRATDLALLRIDAEDVQAVALAEAAADDPDIGRWLVSVSPGPAPAGAGIVSVETRRIPARRVLLGVEIRPGDQGPRVRRLIPGMGAARAGLQTGDIITHVGGQATKNHADVVTQLKDLAKGDQIDVQVVRGEEELTFTIDLAHIPASHWDRGERMNRMGGELSERTHGFEEVIQHDTVLRPDQIGGPVVDLDGNLIGLNIARAGRIATYVLPADLVHAAVLRIQEQHGGD